eukprot:1010519_1
MQLQTQARNVPTALDHMLSYPVSLRANTTEVIHGTNSHEKTLQKMDHYIHQHSAALLSQNRLLRPSHTLSPSTVSSQPFPKLNSNHLFVIVSRKFALQNATKNGSSRAVVARIYTMHDSSAPTSVTSHSLVHYSKDVMTLN